ncbi:hypothetical protein KBC55_03575 [Patescibacteria group bacterium]|nr:hypothetical protein [Patescibacteria group bacterium]
MISTLKKVFVAGALALLPFGVAAVPSVHAQSALESTLDDVQAESGLGDQDLTTTLGMLIQAMLGLLGVIFLVLIIYAGFLWMTAGGDEGKVSTAKDIMIRSVVGLVILLSAYAISSFVIDALIEATGSGS